MQEWELVARERLRDLIARYNLAGDRGWIDEVTELFTPDAVLQVDDVEHVGVDAIRGVFNSQVLTVHGLDHWGRYTDRFRCVDGSWLFSRRDVRVDGATPGGWAELRGYTGRGGESEHAGRHDVP